MKELAQSDEDMVNLDKEGRKSKKAPKPSYDKFLRKITEKDKETCMDDDELAVKDADNIDSFESDSSMHLSQEEDDDDSDPEVARLNRLNRYYGKFKAHQDPS